MNAVDAAPELGSLLEYLKRSRGFDFTGYKRASLARRIQKRMQTVGLQSYIDYRDYLEVHPEEFTLLFNAILINVTSFMRDLPVWEYLTTETIPRIIQSKAPNEPIRVWSAGCASGEEAHSLAMVLAEALGVEQFRERVKIYATDVDEEALSKARQASYSAKEVQSVPEDLLDRYFEVAGGHYLFHKELRRSVIFGRHDLMQDAPISRIDLLVSRNALMYFNAEAQARILARFHFAVNDGGYLLMGRAEMLLTHAHLFSPVDLKSRIFAKVPKVNVRDRVAIMARAGSEDSMDNGVTQTRVRETAFDEGPVAHVVVDINGTVTAANARARSLFGLVPSDMGRPLQDLELSYRPAELRSCIEQAYSERRPILLKNVEWPSSTKEGRSFDVQVQPLQDAARSLLGVSITFTDVTRYLRLQDELKHANEERESAYEELQSTNEELETTNEELQSTIEELETTNEELQSTNEELETMNEELQSTNEELETINEELGRRRDELNQSNAFLESILTGLRGAVVVLDRDMRIQIWNHKSEDLWGLRTDEVQGTHFLNLDIGLPVEQLRPLIRASLAGERPQQEIVLESTNRRGKTIQCQMTVTPLLGAVGESLGAILLIEEVGETKPA